MSEKNQEGDSHCSMLITHRTWIFLCIQYIRSLFTYCWRKFDGRRFFYDWRNWTDTPCDISTSRERTNSLFGCRTYQTTVV